MRFADELRRAYPVSSRTERLNQTLRTMYDCVKENAQFSARRGLHSLSGFPGRWYYDDYSFLSESDLKLFIGSDAERRAARNREFNIYLEGTLGMTKTKIENMYPSTLIYFDDVDDARYIAEQLVNRFRADGYTRYSAKAVELHELIRIRKGGLLGDKLSYQETGKCHYAVQISVSW